MITLPLPLVMQSARINLKYKSPSQDFERYAGYNPDGSLNMTSTLERMRQMLASSLKTIEKLIEVKDELLEIHPMGIDIVHIYAKEEVIKKLTEDDVLTIAQPPVDENHYHEPRETGEERLRRLENILAVYDPVRLAIEPIENLQQQARNADLTDESDSDQDSNDDENWDDIVIQRAMIDSLHS
jgi:hypothetical protein